MTTIAMDYSLRYYFYLDNVTGIVTATSQLYPYFKDTETFYNSGPFYSGAFDVPSAQYPDLESTLPVIMSGPGPQWLVDQYNAYMNPNMDPSLPIAVVGTLKGVNSDYFPHVAPKIHPHIIADIAGLQSALNSKQVNITQGTAAQYLRGDLSLSMFPTTMDSFTDGSSNKVFSSADKTKLDGLSAPLSNIFASDIPFSNATTANKLSTTRAAYCSYEFDAVVPFSLLGGSSVTATLQYADDSGMSINLVTLKKMKSATSGLVSGASQTNTLSVYGLVPANKYRKVTLSATGNASTPSTISSSQEVLI